MRIVFDDIKESLAPNFKGGEKSFASKAFSDGKNKMMKGRLMPGASIGMHRHEGNCEMIYVLEHSFINDGDCDLVFIAVVPAQ